MADPTAEALALLYGRGHEMRGGFARGPFDREYRPPDMPMRPSNQPMPEPPSAHGMYVDRVEEKDPGMRGAVLTDPYGNSHDTPVRPGMQEGHYEDGSMPPGDEAAAIRARLSAGDRGGNFSLEDVGSKLPVVPLAPGSPGPPLPPPADSFIGQKKAPQKKKRPTP